MFRYLSADVICSSKLTVFLELRSRKTVRFSEQITSADKYLSIFSRQMEAIVYLYSLSTPTVQSAFLYCLFKIIVYLKCSRLPITRTLANSNLALTRSNFCFPSDHFLYNFETFSSRLYYCNHHI